MAHSTSQNLGPFHFKLFMNSEKRELEKGGREEGREEKEKGRKKGRIEKRTHIASPSWVPGVSHLLGTPRGGRVKTCAHLE